MLLTQIKIQNLYESETKLKGIANVVFDKALAVHDIKILQSDEGFFLAMPSKKKGGKITSNEFSDIVHPINKEMREILEKIIFISYDYCVSEGYSYLCMEMIENCEKVNIFEQDISDFEVIDQLSFMIDAKKNFDKPIANIHKKEIIDSPDQKPENSDVKVIPIFNYVPGVILKRVDSPQNTIEEKILWKKIDFAGINRQITSSDISILSWIGKLGYATGKNIYALLKAGIIEKSPNYVFNEAKVKNRLSHTFAKAFQLVDVYKFSDTKSDREYRSNIYMVSSFGNKVLKSLNLYNLNNVLVLKLQDIATIKKTMAQNQWFCAMVEKYREILDFYSIDVIMDTENSIEGRANVKIYVNIAEQPIFAEAFRRVPKWDNDINIQECYNKIQRVCLLSNDYENVTINLRNAGMKKRPIIVIIGENEEHCRELYEVFKEIKTEAKIVYTYDILVSNDIRSAHFEFVDGNIVPFDFFEESM